MKAYRHGDVVIRQLTDQEYSAISDARILNKDYKQKTARQLTLAEGEITGHSHVLTIDAEHQPIDWGERRDFNIWLFGNGSKDGSLNLSQLGDFKVLDLQNEATLTHEEHAQIDIPAGQYIVYQQRESWTGNAPRRVYD